jgi:hypothetical protein
MKTRYAIRKEKNGTFAVLDYKENVAKTGFLSLEDAKAYIRGKTG